MPLSPNRDATDPEHKCSSARTQNPWVGSEVFESRNYAIPNRHFRFPSQCTHLLRIEQDDWIVTDPSTITAAVLNRRRHAQRIADPTDRVIYLAIRLATQIEDAHPIARLFYRQQYRINAVMNVKIGFTLSAVS